MALKDDEIKLLQWIYWRMIDIHNEKQGADYMYKFSTIIDYLKSSGSVAAPKEEELCPTCGSAWGNINGRYYSNSWHLATPAIQKELASLRQQLATYTHFDMLAMVARQTKHMFEENEQLREALKELLTIAERKFNGISIDDAASHREYIALKAIIERARKLISK